MSTSTRLSTSDRSPAPWSDGGRMGVALGMVLLVSFVVAGRGVGASGAFAVAAGALLEVAAPGVTGGAEGLADRLPSAVSLWSDWAFLQLAGVFIGGAVSAWWSGRWRTAARTTPSRRRLARAVAGGVLMGLGARLAYGCTSGLALSGGALLATGAWLFIPVAFATAITLTFLSRGGAPGSGA